MGSVKLYEVKMLQGWYDRLRKEIKSFALSLAVSERYSDGSTTCRILFTTTVEKDDAEAILRHKLDDFSGWLEIKEVK